MRHTRLWRYIVMIKDDKNKKLGNSSPGYSTLGVSTSTFSRKAFSKKLVNFIQKTKDHAIQTANPGGYYTGLWCRDSSYIFKDWFLSGRIQEVLDQIIGSNSCNMVPPTGFH